MDPEQTLIARAQRGDAAAFQELVRQHEQLAFRAAFLITRDEHEAADAAQDAFVRAYRALGTFRTGEPFRPWLLRIVSNLALNRVQAARRRERMHERYARDIEGEAAPDNPVANAARREQNERLMQAVRHLKPDEQWLIALRYFVELPESEVAHALSIPAGTVKSRLHRTLSKLRDLIRRDYPDLAELTEFDT